MTPERFMRRKPTRRDLLIVIGQLQNIIGAIGSAANDRNPNRAAHIAEGVAVGVDLCIEVRSYDPPLKQSGPWSVVEDFTLKAF